MFIVDTHLDLSYNAVLRGRDVTRPAMEQPVVDNEIATVGLPDLRKGGVGLICGTIFSRPRSYRKDGYVTADEAHAQAMKQWGWYQEQFSREELSLVKSAPQVPGRDGLFVARVSNPCFQDKKTGYKPVPHQAIAMILLMEGADAFRSPDDVRWWFEQGLRIVGLAWRRTRMAGGTGEPGPLTSEGRSIVRALDAVGIIQDLSHLADESFWELLEMTDRPVMASHSNCRAIVPADRQISDEMIKAIAQRKGVIGLNFYDQFLLPPEQYKKRRCTLADLVAHIKHICDLVGSAAHVGLGTDMDGGVGREDIPQEITTAADLPRVADALASAGFGDEDITAIMSGNWLGFFSGALPQ